MNQTTTSSPYRTYRNGNKIILYKLNLEQTIYLRVAAVDFDFNDKFYELEVTNLDPLIVVPLLVNLGSNRGMCREQVIKYLEAHGWVDANC